MFAYDKTFDPKVFLCHRDLISCFIDFALYLHTQLVYFHTSRLYYYEYDKTFDPKVLIGQCELISRCSDFALYLSTQLVY